MTILSPTSSARRYSKVATIGALLASVVACQPDGTVLSENGAVTINLNVVFPEPSQSAAADMASAYASSAAEIDRVTVAVVNTATQMPVVRETELQIVGDYAEGDVTIPVEDVPQTFTIVIYAEDSQNLVFLNGAASVVLQKSSSGTEPVTVVLAPPISIAGQGTVEVSSVFNQNPIYDGAKATDLQLRTSWFSGGETADGNESVFTWTAADDVFIGTTGIFNNSRHSNPSFQSGFGFDQVKFQVFSGPNGTGSILYEETVSYPKSFPLVRVTPLVVGRSIRLTFVGHESPDCGGFSELLIVPVETTTEPLPVCPVQFTGTGNHYGYIANDFNLRPNGISWSEAQQEAETMFCQAGVEVLQGYLATVTSQAENDFLTQISNAAGWLGGTDQVVEGDWQWASGPEAGIVFWSGGMQGSVQNGLYANWAPGEPNNSAQGVPEHFLARVGQDAVPGSEFRWNDEVGTGREGYWIEFGQNRAALQLAPDELCSDFSPSDIASFEDPNLEAEVRNALSLGAQANITCGALTGLTSLTANSVGIVSLVGIQNLTGLTTLNLGVNSIVDISPVGGLTGLTQLFLFDNAITDITAVAGLTNLTRFEIAQNSVADLSPLSTLTNLSWLQLWQNNVTDVTPISGLTTLTFLDLNSNGVSDISSLSGLTNLDHLNLTGNQVASIQVLSGFTELTTLIMFGTGTTDITALTNLVNLRQLDLRFNIDLSDIQPLVINTGLGSGDSVQLEGTSVNCVDVDALRAKGASVTADC